MGQLDRDSAEFTRAASRAHDVQQILSLHDGQPIAVTQRSVRAAGNRRQKRTSCFSQHWRCELTGDDPVTRYDVRAVRWEHGWELNIDGVGVTQSEGLDDAERTAVDLIARYTGSNPAEVTVNVIISSA